MLPLLVGASIPAANEHLRAASLLLRIENPDDQGRMARYHTYAVWEMPERLATPTGVVRARLYTPLGATQPGAMVVVHGVHHLGVDEPRLVAFSRALCASGIKVYTPELPQLADYHVTDASEEVIGAAVNSLSGTTGRPVGLLGLSFAGGLALLAASDPRYAEHVAFVVSIGAHEDMKRVAEFYASGRIARPDGSVVSFKPHEYGPLVLMYTHPEEFFPAKDVATAREVLRLLLWEQVNESKKAAEKLSPESQKMMERVYAHDQSQVQSVLQKAIARHSEEMEKVSPQGQLANLRVPVLLLHGAGDDVIPATEMLWLEKEVPERYLRSALTTPLLSHVNVAAEPPAREKLALVHFMAEMFELADKAKGSAKKVN
jgi:dienelactone hydrolase